MTTTSTPDPLKVNNDHKQITLVVVESLPSLPTTVDLQNEYERKSALV